jgi:hypothetical protein
MTKTLIAMLALTFALSACESETPDNNSNANAARPNATTQATPATLSTASPEASPAARSELKAGDKVKVTTNGASVQATVVSVDEKAGKVTVSVPGEKENRTLAIADVVKQ